MKKIILVFIIFFYVNLSAQKSSHFLNKIDNSEIIFDGVVNEDEIKNAAEIELKYEISPRYNKQVKQSEFRSSTAPTGQFLNRIHTRPALVLYLVTNTKKLSS